jgi:hypothetical protein
VPQNDHLHSLLPPKMHMSLYSSVLLLLPVFSFAQTIVVATQVVTVSPSAATSSSQYTSDSDFQSSILNSTNTFRSEHNATALTWNTSLATYASDYANNCVWQHSVRVNDPHSTAVKSIPSGADLLIETYSRAAHMARTSRKDMET